MGLWLTYPSCVSFRMTYGTRVQTRRDALRWSGKDRIRDPRGGQRRHLLSGLLVCGECGAHYIIKTREYYGCASNINRGKSICANTRLARKSVLEERIMRTIENQVFSPEAVAYLTDQVNAAIERLAKQAPAATATARNRDREMSQARAELENIKAAIRQGILTPSTKTMLEEAEARVARLEGASSAPASIPRTKVTAIPTVIAGYLHDLRKTLGRDTERARTILSRLVGQITLQSVKDGLVAEVRANVPGILNPQELRYCQNGAGRGI